MNVNFLNLAQLQATESNVASGVAKASAAMRAIRNERQIREAAESFEAVFISQMLAPMFKGISGDGEFGGGHAENIFRSIQIEELGKAIAKNGGVGIAQTVYREILKSQEI